VGRAGLVAAAVAGTDRPISAAQAAPVSNRVITFRNLLNLFAATTRKRPNGFKISIDFGI
jgi:hypothetical protein